MLPILKKLLSTRSLVLILLVTNALFGVYRYIQKPLLPSRGQGDLLVNIVAQQKILDQPMFVSQEFADSVIPVPYLLTIYPLIDFLGGIEWELLTNLWTILNILLVFAMGLLMIRLMKREGSDITILSSIGFVVIGSLFLFKGTHGAIAAGQVGYLAILAVMLFFYFESSHPQLAKFFLILASFKLNIFMMGFLYLFLERKWKDLFVISSLIVVVNIIISLFYLGPLEHIHIIIDSYHKLEHIAINSIDLRGLSGRVDIAPALVALGIAGVFNKLLVVLLFSGSLGYFYWKGKGFSSHLHRLVAVLVSLLCVYHRDQDLLLLAYAAIPLVLANIKEIRPGDLVLLLPLVLPLTFIAIWGVARFPSYRIIFDIIGGLTAWAFLWLLIQIGQWVRMKKTLS